MKSSEQKEPADQKKRQIFITGVTENFSVIAPAGVGKTQAIVERIVHISRHPRASEWLPKLVVVTFTNKAADEMQQRRGKKFCARVSQSKFSKLLIAHFLARSTAFA